MPGDTVEQQTQAAAPALELERILLSLDTLARTPSEFVYPIVDACEGLAKFLRARQHLHNAQAMTIRVGDDGNAFQIPVPASAVSLPSAPLPGAPAAPPAPPPVSQPTAPGGPPCEEQLLQQQDPKRRGAIAADGYMFLNKVRYYLEVAAAKKADAAGVADAIGSIDCLPVPHAVVAAADIANAQVEWDACYATFTELKTGKVIDGDDEAGILYALGDRPGTVRIVPGDERDTVDSGASAYTLPPEPGDH